MCDGGEGGGLDGEFQAKSCFRKQSVKKSVRQTLVVTQCHSLQKWT